MLIQFKFSMNIWTSNLKQHVWPGIESILTHAGAENAVSCWSHQIIVFHIFNMFSGSNSRWKHGHKLFAPIPLCYYYIKIIILLENFFYLLSFKRKKHFPHFSRGLYFFIFLSGKFIDKSKGNNLIEYSIIPNGSMTGR